HPGTQFELVTNQIHLSPLRRGQVVTLLEERAGVLHGRIEHRFEKIVAQVVMRFADLAGATPRLAIDDQRSTEGEEIAKSECETLLEMGADGAATHLVECLAVPPAIHVGFAKRERAAGQDARKKARVMNLNIPGVWAVDSNVGRREKIFDHR